MPDPPRLHAHLRAHGYVHLRGVYGAAELDDIRAQLDAGLARHPAPPLDAWGTELVPLLDHAPGLARHLDAPALTEPLAEALGGPVVRLASAGRFSSLGGGGFLPWHFHAPGEGRDGDGRWQPDRAGAPDGIGPVIVCGYADGADHARGPVWLAPRSTTAPFAPPSTDRRARWPGMVELEPAPGDVLVFGLATYHAAWCHHGPRRLFGGVVARADGQRIR